MANRPFDLCDTSPTLSTRLRGPGPTSSRVSRGETTQSTKPETTVRRERLLLIRVNSSLCLAQGREQPGLLCLGLPDLPILGQDQRLGLAELFVLALDQPVLAGDQVGIEALRNAGGTPAVQP